MKLIALLCLSLVIIIPQVTANSYLQLSQFAIGWWRYYNLTPTTMLTCWNNTSAATLISMLETSYELTQAYIANHKDDVKTFTDEFNSLYQSIQGPINCTVNTKDVYNLYDAMGIKSYNFTFLQTFFQLYFPAHLIDWATNMAPVYDSFKANQFYQAGQQTAPVVYQAKLNATHCQSSGVHLQAFFNGIFYQLNQTLPYVINDCFNDTTSYVEIAFLYSWFNSVGSGTKDQALNNTLDFFSGQGKELQGRIPESVHECITNSKDTQVLNSVLGEKFGSGGFNTTFIDYIKNEGDQYFNYMSQALELFEKDGFWSTGEVIANVLFETSEQKETQKIKF